MSFVEQPAAAVSEDHGEGAAVFESQHERPSDQRGVGHFVIGGSFEPVQPGNRHPGPDQETLIAADGVAHRAEGRSVLLQSAGSAQFLDQLEGGVLHLFILQNSTFPA